MTSEYHRREQDRRFAIYLNGRLHCETRDLDHAMHLKRLYENDAPVIRVFTANQTAWGDLSDG